MADSFLLYYITDRAQFPGDEANRRRLLLEKIAEAARSAVDYVQLREKDLTTRELESLAREVLHTIRQSSRQTTRLLVNSRVDVAIASGADGVHLRSEDITARDVRTVWNKCGAGAARVLVSVSCHSPAEAARAAAAGADFAVFAPVFEKKGAPTAPAAGLEALHQACQARIPVLALGGITLENAHACVRAGAAGIAAIRLFQENDIAKIVSSLRTVNGRPNS
jgi:thiamine-phosphate pyrophosphorylase